MGPIKPGMDNCQLLGPASLLVQCLMGISALALMLFKRNHEHPRRKMEIWLFDIGKQIIGALGIHFINVGISVLKRHHKKKAYLFISIVGNLTKSVSSTREDDGSDEQCDWYFLNLLLDTTVGIPILWLAINCITYILQYLNIKNVESGNYFAEEENDIESQESEQPLITAFFKQLGIFTSSLIVMKICVYLVLNYFEDLAYWFANLILSWSDRWPDLQVTLVMFVFPIILNCFQYFCVDNVIKLHSDDVNNYNSKSFEPEEVIQEEYTNLISGAQKKDKNKQSAYETIS